ncbi:MAG: hypothetical protein ACT4PL_04675 [Phycisphaerales bacterium]
MGHIAYEWWAVIVGITLTGVFAMLHALAAGLRNIQRVVEFKLAVKRLRDDHAQRMNELRARKGLAPLEPPH